MYKAFNECLVHHCTDDTNLLFTYNYHSFMYTPIDIDWCCRRSVEAEDDEEEDADIDTDADGVSPKGSTIIP